MLIIQKYEDKINGVLSCFDRVILKGHIRQFYSLSGKKHFLSKENLRYMDFGDYALKVTEKIKKNAINMAKELNRPYIYLNSPKISKEKTAQKCLEENPVEEGLICVLSTLELCSTLQVIKNTQTGNLELRNVDRKCLYLYFYYLDREFGFMHVKLQTWFPFMIQVYINGREYLARQLDKHGIKYNRYDNSFTYISDIEKAQELADKIESLKLCGRLDAIASRINPFLARIYEVFHQGYYWCVDQCEYATDVMFNSRKDIEEIYPALVEHALLSFKCEDVMIFLGRKMHHAFQGEIVSDIKKRPQGIRIKHRMKSNIIKMYDKYSVLRVETTINDPHEFKILKKVQSEEGEVMRWVKMGKSIANLYRYAQICRASNGRYLDAVAQATFTGEIIEELEKLCVKTKFKNRNYTGFNVLSPETCQVFLAVMNGAYHIKGFTNKDIRIQIFSDLDIDDKKVRNKTTRILAKLKAHRLISKIPHSFRYKVSKKGLQVMSTILRIKAKEYPYMIHDKVA
jgi:hypothetical protein